MLFTKPIEQITFEDIDNFCKEGLEESSRLEYKRDFSSKDANFQIAKEIAAFANTYGGILLIGVAEGDKDRKPKLPIEGINYDKGLNEKINSIALRNIYPPVFPEVQVCQLKGQSEKAVIVVRVSQSDETPHLLNNRTKIYVKVDSQSEPIEPPWEQVEWLINRRQKAIENKERLISRARERFKFLCQDKPISFSSEVFTIPFFPSAYLANVLKLKNAVEDSRFRGFHYEFPSIHIRSKTQNESLIYHNISLSSNVEYVDVNQFGLIFNKKGYLVDEEPEYKDKIEIYSILEAIFNSLNFACRFYKDLGYWGILQVTLKLEGIRGKHLYSEADRRNIDYYTEKSTFLDNELAINRRILTGELSEQLEDTIADIHSEFLYSGGLDDIAQNDTQIKGQIRRINPP